MGDTENYANLQQNISASLISTTRATSRLCAEDMDFHRSCNPSLGRKLDEQNARLLALTRNLLDLQNQGPTVEKTPLTDIESIDVEWRSIIEKTDILLEKVDTLLDEFAGLVRRTNSDQQHQMLDPSNKIGNAGKRAIAIYTPMPAIKPQLLFEDPPANHETNPFQPLLTSKPHYISRLTQPVASTTITGQPQSQHPYEEEICAYTYPLSVYTRREPVPSRPFDNTNVTYVDDFDGVLAMLESLKDSSEIAVDLEHHDTHSYLGIVCLMQISIRGFDWVVDTLKPWRRKLQVLNEVFADPKILKVFHGAQMDVLWLQRDLGLYLVGLFDTYHASRALGYPAASLAYLLKKFVNFNAQKQYQTADWRIRPLPQEMLDYARSDTHFLLQIFDNIRNELIDESDFNEESKDKVSKVLEKSKETALQQYEYPFYDYSYGLGRNGYLSLLQKTSMDLDRQSLTILRRVHQWRDVIARADDENVNQIMPNHVLINLARAKPLTLSSLLSVSHPLYSSVRRRTSELLYIVRGAIEESDFEPDLSELLSKVNNKRSRTSTQGHHFISKLIDKSTIEARPQNSPDLRLGISSFWGPLPCLDYVQAPHNTYLKSSKLWSTTCSPSG